MKKLNVCVRVCMCRSSWYVRDPTSHSVFADTVQPASLCSVVVQGSADEQVARCKSILWALDKHSKDADRTFWVRFTTRMVHRSNDAAVMWTGCLLVCRCVWHGITCDPFVAHVSMTMSMLPGSRLLVAVRSD